MQTMGKMFIINAPKIFTIIWSFVKRIIDPRTVSKIDVVGTNYLPKLLVYVDAENLPVQFGGLDTTPWPGVEPGPWDIYVKNAHVHGNNIRHLFTDESDMDDRVKPRQYAIDPVHDAATADEIVELVSARSARGAFQSPDPMPRAHHTAAVPHPDVSPPIDEKDGALLAQLDVLEADTAKYRSLLLTPSPPPMQDFKTIAPPGSVLARVEALEHAMMQLKTAVGDNGSAAAKHTSSSTKASGEASGGLDDERAQCCIIQ